MSALFTRELTVRRPGEERKLRAAIEQFIPPDGAGKWQGRWSLREVKAKRKPAKIASGTIHGVDKLDCLMNTINFFARLIFRLRQKQVKVWWREERRLREE